jgi:ubiquinone biosynthesis protein COQ9
MAKTEKTEQDHIKQAREQLLTAALPLVSFDGWGGQTFTQAVADSGVDADIAALACPRGGLDLALAYHRQGDAQMLEALEATDMSDMRFRDRITLAIRLRLQASGPDKEAVRRATTLFSLPQNTAEGAQAIWRTADLIWTALGDTSTDINWYSKRATVSAVYSATVLFWLGDQSEENADTWAFLDRRIADVMQIEEIKARIQQNPLVKGFMQGPGRIFEQVKAPDPDGVQNLPGHISDKG